MPTRERITYGADGTLDEVVTRGTGAHLERLDDGDWHLALMQEDGGEVHLWLAGRVAMIEEWPPSPAQAGG